MDDSLNILDAKILVGSRLLQGCIAISNAKIVKVGKKASMCFRPKSRQNICDGKTSYGPRRDSW